MDIAMHLETPRCAWTSGRGAMADVVVSSRARLARNLDGVAFPDRLTSELADGVLRRVHSAVDAFGGGWSFVRLAELEPVDRQVLVEKHLISPQQMQEPQRAALAVRDDEGLSLMVNEEDHLRLQAFQPGLSVRETLAEALAADDRLEETLDFSFTPELGYLTACPTNVGTGLRLSVMLHLGGLVRTRGIAQLLQVLPKLGLAVRGLYGEGTEAAGDLFQVSNQITLGQAEEEVAASIERAAQQIIDQERAARRMLKDQALAQTRDRVHRALGVLRYAQLLSGQEAMQLLSEVRLGVEMGLLQVSPEVVNELLVMTLPGFLARTMGHELQALEERGARARTIRERLQKEGV